MSMADPFDSLTSDLAAVFRPQREWAQRRGLLLITAHFLTGAGAGAWIFSAVFGFLPGLFVGLAIVLLGSLCHLMFLGRASRFWRIAARVQSSWISRGLLGMIFFSVFAFLYLILGTSGQREGVLQQVILAASLIGAIWICIYKGFVWAMSRGIPFWNSALLPAVFIAYALRGGIAVLFVSFLLTALPSNAGLLEMIKLWIAISSGALIILYVAVMPSTGITAKRSVKDLVKGRLSTSFYVGAIFFGLVVPIALGGLGYATELPLYLIGIIGLSSLIGDFFTIYSVARAGYYRPLMGELPGSLS